MNDLIFGIFIALVGVFIFVVVAIMGWWKWLLGILVILLVFITWTEYQFIKLRQKIVAKYVDKAVLGNKKDKFGALRRYKPDVVCLGYDQVVFVDEMKLEVKQQGLKTKVVRLKSHKPNVFKSSIMAKK